jgi:hypothetical protein
LFSLLAPVLMFLVCGRASTDWAPSTSASARWLGRWPRHRFALMLVLLYWPWSQLIVPVITKRVPLLREQCLLDQLE